MGHNNGATHFAYRNISNVDGHRLTSRGHLSEIIPNVMEREKETLKNEIAPIDGFSVIFDGSCRLGEALGIVIRFINKNWNIQEMLVRLETLARV